ncbi:MAG: cell shape determination protein CcmA [endosymbiont of Galathealinum brachiosum]|uniref:Cell shape determination protein CcmA n=1 Tax=endosymbiont of Galathealinum brachiosum TaxID=2200906 RepID=A0A370DDW8_9GAMM|nr:MAG: cell shape determination protein CcmA [endosymbiont of Galathealinum brachiosum]
MWGKKKNKSTKIETLIGTAMEIQGDLIFSGGLHVDGKIVGNVIAEEDSHSMLVLSDQGQIEGEVRVPYVVLNGQVTGDVYASERVELSRHGQVKGNVYYNLLEMAMGAEVNGNLVHCKDDKKLLEFQTDNNEKHEEDSEPSPTAS